MASPDLSRDAFSDLRLPAVRKDRAFYVNHSSHFDKPVKDLLKQLRLKEDHFVSASDYRAARSGGGFWLWEEMAPGEDATRRVSAATSLPALLEAFAPAGREGPQARAAALYAEMFQGCALCYQDFIEVGFSSVSEFLNDPDSHGVPQNRNAFLGDEEDIARTEKKGEVWTMFSHYTGTLLYASSTLKGVLQRAWDNDPRLVLARNMEDVLPDASPHVPHAVLKRRF